MAAYQEVLHDTLWHTHYAFEYWYNRVEKINPHNDRDRLEALFCLGELAELYSRSFSAILQNPNYAWYYLDDIITVNDIEDTFELLADQAELTIGKASKVTGLTNKVDTEESMKWSALDALSIGLLGMPQEVDENGMISLPESPSFHRNICEAILKIAEKQRPLKESFDRGFRVFPVSLDTVKSEIDSTELVNEEQKEAVKQEIESLREQYSTERWPLTYFHINRKKTGRENTVQLFLKHVDAFTCYKLAELVLDALFNLISSGSGYKLNPAISDVPTDIIETDPIIGETIFSIETHMGDDLVRLLTQDDLDKRK